MVVRTVELLEGEDQPRGNKKVVFIGKPLPAKSVTAIEKNRLAFKVAARSILHSWEEDKEVAEDLRVSAPEVSCYIQSLKLPYPVLFFLRKFTRLLTIFVT